MLYRVDFSLFAPKKSLEKGDPIVVKTGLENFNDDCV